MANKVILIGRLGQDPDVRYTANGTAVTNISIAEGKKYKDKTGEQKEMTRWHKVVFFGKLAEIAGQWLLKGKKVYIEGELDYNHWTPEGSDKEVCVAQVKANSMEMLDGGSTPKKQNNMSNQEPNSAQPAYDDFDDDIPF